MRTKLKISGLGNSVFIHDSLYICVNKSKAMLKSFLFFSAIWFSYSFSCNKESALICSVAQPLEDLPWLNQIKKNFELDMSPAIQTIDQYVYNGNHVFLISNCHGCADAMAEVYNCEGKVICEFGGIMGRNTCPDFESKAVLVKNLYHQ